MRLVCAARADAMITNYPDRGKKIAEEYSDGKLTPELVKLLKHKEMAALRMRQAVCILQTKDTGTGKKIWWNHI